MPRKTGDKRHFRYRVLDAITVQAQTIVDLRAKFPGRERELRGAMAGLQQTGLIKCRGYLTETGTTQRYGIWAAADTATATELDQAWPSPAAIPDRRLWIGQRMHMMMDGERRAR